MCLTLLIAMLESAERPLFDPTLTGIPSELREKILSEIVEEEQLFSRLALQQTNKQLCKEMNTLKNGTAERFDAFITKTAQQLGPLSIDTLAAALTELENDELYRLNQDPQSAIEIIRKSIEQLKEARIQELEIPPFIIALLFKNWPSAQKWLNQYRKSIHLTLLMNTDNDIITSSLYQLYFFGAILSRGSLITKHQVIKLPHSVIANITDFYANVSSYFVYESDKLNNLIHIDFSPLFSTLLETVYKVNNIAAQKGFRRPRIFLELNNFIKNKQEPERSLYQKLKSNTKSVLINELRGTIDQFINEITAINEKEKNITITSLITRINQAVAELSDRNYMQKFCEISKYIKHLLALISAKDHPYSLDLWQTISLIIDNILFLEMPPAPQVPSKRPL